MKKIIIAILIIFLVIVIFFIYNLLGEGITKINNITENQKREIVSLMGLDNYYKEINLEEITVPLTYKDIYYKIYFNCSTNIDINSIASNQNYDLDFDKIKDNQYICTISNMGRQIEMLEKIRTEYSK